MQYDFKELHVLNQLSDDPEVSKRFTVPPDLRNMSIIIMLTLALALAAGISFKVDQIVPAQGILETQQKLFEIRATESGLVYDINVAEGQVVREGDAVVTLDPEPLQLQISAIESQQERIARTIWTDFYQISDFIPESLRDNLADRIGQIDDPIDDFGYDELLRKTLANDLQVFEKSVAELAERYNRDAAQLMISSQSLDISQSALDRQTELLSQELGSKSQKETAHRQFLEAKDRVSLLQANLKTLDAEGARLEAEKTKARDQFTSERLVRIHDNVDEFERLRFEKRGLLRRLAELELKAPFDGVIDKLNVLGSKEVIEAGKSVAAIRPNYDPNSMMIEMMVPSNYAIWVQEGMPFRASSLGNSPEDHGYIIGTVGYVSKSTEEQNGSRLYRIRGEIEKFDYTDRVERVEATETLVRPGLQLSVEIKVGKRRLINYILDPFSDGFKRALSEPS